VYGDECTKRQARTGAIMTLKGMLIAEMTWRGLAEKTSVGRKRRRRSGHLLEVEDTVDQVGNRNKNVIENACESDISEAARDSTKRINLTYLREGMSV
jgi:hypothetical protein